jgi:hypothetical protein
MILITCKNFERVDTKVIGTGAKVMRIEAQDAI